MYDVDAVVAPLEVKFASDAAAGTFEGYAAVFGKVDGHGDLIVAGAFRDSLRAKKAQGRSLPMYANHGAFLGGDPLPVGVWKSVEEDDHGLKVVGEVAALDTDYGKRIYGLIKSGALGGLSIGYRVPPNGAVMGSKPGDPRRTLKKLDLLEISPVDDPAQAEARIQSVKSARGREDFVRRLRDGDAPATKDFEDFLGELGVPKSLRTRIASHGYSSAIRSESGGFDPAIKSALTDLRAAAAGFQSPRS